MTTIPLTDCCTMLGIDPKTLRHWLHQAQMPLHVHPTDARIKCLTREQVQQLAVVHARPLTLPEALAPSPLVLSSPLSAEDAPTDTDLALVQRPHCQSETDLLKKLAHLETHMTTMQQQLAQLALELLQERTERYEQRLHTLEALIQSTERQTALPPALQTMERQCQQGETDCKERGLHPAELRARSRVIPLIEYGAGGSYVVICPQEGDSTSRLIRRRGLTGWRRSLLSVLSASKAVSRPIAKAACHGAGQPIAPCTSTATSTILAPLII